MQVAVLYKARPHQLVGLSFLTTAPSGLHPAAAQKLTTPAADLSQCKRECYIFPAVNVEI